MAELLQAAKKEDLAGFPVFNYKGRDWYIGAHVAEQLGTESFNLYRSLKRRHVEMMQLNYAEVSIFKVRGRTLILKSDLDKSYLKMPQFIARRIRSPKKATHLYRHTEYSIPSQSTTFTTYCPPPPKPESDLHILAEASSQLLTNCKLYRLPLEIDSNTGHYTPTLKPPHCNNTVSCSADMNTKPNFSFNWVSQS